MGDFPGNWEWVEDLTEGGQAHTFVVRQRDTSAPGLYVLKRLKNPTRIEYFEREIQACSTLNHPNVLNLVEHGFTPKRKPYLVTEYCPAGSLNRFKKFEDPAAGLRFFEQIVEGIAHAHQHAPPIYHLDLKPENILLKGETPLVGDFGICFIEDGQFTLTSEGPLGSKHYCPPELRGPKITGSPPLGTADVYSLGKLLYWLFTHEVYDGSEEDYTDEPDRHLGRLFPSTASFAFIDDALVSRTIRRKPLDRITNAIDLLSIVRQLAQRIEAGGRVLDLRKSQQCIYCQEGRYRPIHDEVATDSYMARPLFPEVEKRRQQEDVGLYPDRSIYSGLRKAADRTFRLSQGSNHVGMPLVLVCDYCGNVQYFRLDWTKDKIGENWRP